MHPERMAKSITGQAITAREASITMNLRVTIISIRAIIIIISHPPIITSRPITVMDVGIAKPLLDRTVALQQPVDYNTQDRLDYDE